MQLLDHVSIGVPDMDAARRFYDAIMDALGAAKVYDLPHALGYGERCTPKDAASTCLAVYLDHGQVTDSKRHWCFKAASREQVDVFHAAGLAAGGARMVNPVCALITMPDITLRSCATRRVIALKRFAIFLRERLFKPARCPKNSCMRRRNRRR